MPGGVGGIDVCHALRGLLIVSSSASSFTVAGGDALDPLFELIFWHARDAKHLLCLLR
jgi:hypothetical protein